MSEFSAEFLAAAARKHLKKYLFLVLKINSRYLQSSCSYYQYNCIRRLQNQKEKFILGVHLGFFKTNLDHKMGSNQIERLEIRT